MGPSTVFNKHCAGAFTLIALKCVIFPYLQMIFPIHADPKGITEHVSMFLKTYGYEMLLHRTDVAITSMDGLLFMLVEDTYLLFTL